ncbi:uncharacterized protein NPIL_612601 [Nephila pilipes]|uniref:Uncharacterized protein n=1 Tax=Nephila pilipes TaxID=299642 RepID=A0A8X6TB32_NEPPI|nr:uncharacterized protein NPIL_612601 [Nephila pilipes]
MLITQVLIIKENLRPVAGVLYFFNHEHQILAISSSNSSHIEYDFWNRIHWYSHGTINRLETARAFIQDEYIDIRQRFHLAVTYYFEEDVRTLWGKIPTEYQTLLQKCSYLNKTWNLWLNAINTGTPLDWTQITRIVEDDKFSSTNALGLLRVFPKLVSSEARFQSLAVATRGEQSHPFDLYLCLIQMEDDELRNALHRFPEEEKYLFMKSFLHWPLQSVFQYVVEFFRNNISISIYSKLFRFILCEKFDTQGFDHDYFDLVKAFWAPISTEIKSELERYHMFQCLRQILKSDGNQSTAIDFIRICKRWRFLR